MMQTKQVRKVHSYHVHGTPDTQYILTRLERRYMLPFVLNYLKQFEIFRVASSCLRCVVCNKINRQSYGMWCLPKISKKCVVCEKCFRKLVTK